MILIEQLIRENWPYFDDIRGFDFDSEPEVPTTVKPFGEITFPVDAVETQRSWGAPGSNTYREESGFRFRIFIPRAEDLRTWIQRMDELRDALRAYRDNDNGLRIHEVPSASITSRSEIKGYRELSIGVDYILDIHR